jgi:membrane-bound lytic murein transglycosylase A
LAPKPAIDAADRMRRRRRRMARLLLAGALAPLPMIAAPTLASAESVPHKAPFQIANGQYIPATWNNLPGWRDDNQLAAFMTFRASCKPIMAQRKPVIDDSKALGASLREPCRVALAQTPTNDSEARGFFERHFVPLRISRLGEADGFVTGYYEPVLEGSKTSSETFSVPVYRRPSNLFVRGFAQDAASLPNKGEVFRKIGRRKLVPYYSRSEIEDGILSGRGLEICYLKSSTDLLFMQIQGSARIKLEDGSTIRVNYDSYNGQPYTPVGRILMERNIIPREQMSMQRIREWMDANPDGAKELRRQNKSYVFFREVKLSDAEEAVGAQGIPLTAGRSIAVDKSLHVYGTPFFISADLPIASAQSSDPFHRLMVAQDTGSAILGPARADIYFGAGTEAGQISGRLRHPAQFVMLAPRALDPVAAGKSLPRPRPRPSARIARSLAGESAKTAPDAASSHRSRHRHHRHRHRR